MSEHADKTQKTPHKLLKPLPQHTEEAAPQYEESIYDVFRTTTLSAGAPIDPNALTANTILQLQGMIGNQAVQRLMVEGHTIQRDPAIEPPNTAEAGTLNPEQVSAALHYNLDRFADDEELRMMRSVLGLSPDVSQLINEEFVQAVARWQASHNLEDIDGKLGRDTVSSLVAEYRAEAGNAPEMATHADRLAIRTRPNERADNITVNGHSDLFDAVLSHRNATLTLVMRVNFQFHPGPVGTALTDAEQESFVNRFRREVQGRWAEMYALVPTRDVPDNYLNKYFVEVNIVNTTDNPHYTAYIGNSNQDDDTDPPGPIASGGPAADSDANWLRMGDADLGVYQGNSRAYPDGTEYQMNQHTSAHEFGHMMGLPHIKCDSNSMTCYGGNDVERANIMGLGNRVTRGNYTPFITAIDQITGSSWKAE